MHTIRTLLAGILALMAALVIIYAMLSLRAYLSHGGAASPSGQTMSDQQKLVILESLKGTSTPSTTKSKQLLSSLSASSSTSMSEQAKLDILKGLHTR